MGPSNSGEAAEKEFKMLKNRQFEVVGSIFYISDYKDTFFNKSLRGFAAKYRVSVLTNSGWQTMGYADTKREAIAVAKDWLQYA